MNLRKKLYIEVHKGKFTSRIVGTNERIETNCDQLYHPRTLAGDWEGIQKHLKVVISKHTSFIDKILKPTVLLHLVPKLEGGYTTSELRIFNQLCVAAGANFCLMCDDKYGPLSNEQLKEVFKFW